MITRLLLVMLTLTGSLLLITGSVRAEQDDVPVDRHLLVERGCDQLERIPGIRVVDRELDREVRGALVHVVDVLAPGRDRQPDPPQESKVPQHPSPRRSGSDSNDLGGTRGGSRVAPVAASVRGRHRGAREVARSSGQTQVHGW